MYHLGKAIEGITSRDSQARGGRKKAAAAEPRSVPCAVMVDVIRVQLSALEKRCARLVNVARQQPVRALRLTRLHAAAVTACPLKFRLWIGRLGHPVPHELW